MSDAAELLRHILEAGDIVGRDHDGRTVIQLAVDDVALHALMGFGADGVDLEDAGDDEPTDVPPVHASWLDAA